MGMMDDSAVLSHAMSEPSEEPLDEYTYFPSESVAVNSEDVRGRSHADEDYSLDEADVSSEHSVSEYLISD